MIRASENPFRAARIDRLKYRAHPDSVDVVYDRLCREGFVGCILGNHGCGKTTLLHDLQQRICERGGKVREVFVNDAEPMGWRRANRVLQAVQPDEIVTIDGADLIRPLIWWYLKRAILKDGRGLIVVSHDRELLPVLTRCESGFALFSELVSELVRDRCDIRFTNLNTVYSNSKGNIREAFSILYDSIGR